MSISLNKCNAKKIAEMGNKFILGTLTVATLLTSVVKTEVKAHAYPSFSDSGISQDGDCLYFNKCDDFSMLCNYHDVTEVYISNSVIDGSKKIESDNVWKVTYDNCEFKNGLNCPDGVCELTIKGNIPLSFENLKDKKELSVLNFENCDLNDLTFLENVSFVNNFNVDKCNVGSINGIENLKDLKYLAFTQVGLENIDKLSGLQKLESLTITNSYIIDVSPISKLTSLSQLDLSNNPNIETFDSIMKLTNLKCLFVKNCDMALTSNFIDFTSERITDVSYENLEYQNQIKNIVSSIIRKNMSRKEKIETVVRYVIENMKYDYDCIVNSELQLEYNNNALKYALDGIGCCKNYTDFTTALLNSCGIKAYEAGNEQHVWSVVNVEGEYYYIDSTWLDDEDSKVIFDNNSNYMVNDEEFISMHEASTIPSSMYNKIYGLRDDCDSSFLSSKEDKENNINTHDISTNLKNLPIEITLGIAVALGAAYKLKNKKINQIKKEHDDDIKDK